MIAGPKPNDITGQTFERLTAIEYIKAGKWRCRCVCGEIKTINGGDLKRGKVRSCGCLATEYQKSGDGRRTHGMALSPEYRSCSGMIMRCTQPKTNGYYRYGGRGIKVCERWLNSFENFYEDMGSRPLGTSIDRINNDGNYELGNCRWTDDFTQAANTSTAVLVTANGKTMPVDAWARELGVSGQAIRYRLSKGLSHYQAINTPFRKHVRKVA